MATLNLRRFSNPHALRSIERSSLLEFLEPYRAPFFAGRGLTLPQNGSADGLDFDLLSSILMTPEADTPKDLADALYIINEMSTTEAMDGLIEEAQAKGLNLNGHAQQTPADIAVQIWLQDKDIVERKHAEQFLTRRRSFEYYQTEADPIPKFTKPSAATLKALQGELDDWFEPRKRGRGSRVFIFEKSDGIWFLVRHGDPYRREGAMDQEHVIYRPEKFDVLVYDPKLGEIRMNADSKGEKELYRKQFGKHLFGNDNFFPGQEKYTLEPLRTDGKKSLECVDVEGLDWVKLKEVHYFWGGGYDEVEVRKADDVFAAMEKRGRTMPAHPKIIRARFEVKFTDNKTTRSVTVRPPYAAQFARDSDSAVVDAWLTGRGFVLNGQAP